MIGSFITWVLAITAIVVAVVSLIKNFSREGPPGEKGDTGEKGPLADQALFDAIESRLLVLENYKAAIENSSGGVKVADRAITADCAISACDGAQNWPVADTANTATTAINSTNFDGKPATSYLSNGGQYYLQLTGGGDGSGRCLSQGKKESGTISDNDFNATLAACQNSGGNNFRPFTIISSINGYPK